jgi:hypothetical protein
MGDASAFLEREPDRGLISKSKPSRSELVSSSRNDFAKHEVRWLHVRRRERQRFFGVQKSGSPVPYTQVWGNQKAHFLAEGFYI